MHTNVREYEFSRVQVLNADPGKGHSSLLVHHSYLFPLPSLCLPSTFLLGSQTITNPNTLSLLLTFSLSRYHSLYHYFSLPFLLCLAHSVNNPVSDSLILFCSSKRTFCSITRRFDEIILLVIYSW